MTRLGFVTAMVATALSCSAALASDIGPACGAITAVSAPGGGEGTDLKSAPCRTRAQQGLVATGSLIDEAARRCSSPDGYE